VSKKATRINAPEGFKPSPITAEIAAQPGGLHRMRERQPAQVTAR
jgi:hypothetical protein